MGSKKATAEEMEMRIEFTAFLLQRRQFKSDIKKALQRKYGIQARQCEEYLRLAKEYLTEKHKATHVEMSQQSVDFYESIIVGPDSSISEKMAAQARIDTLQGLGLGTERESGGVTITIKKEVIASRDQIKPELLESPSDG